VRLTVCFITLAANKMLDFERDFQAWALDHDFNLNTTFAQPVVCT
jgi:hypothetical protein